MAKSKIATPAALSPASPGPSNKRAATVSSDIEDVTPIKKKKIESPASSKKKHEEPPPDMNAFLPEELVARLKTSQNSHDFKKYLRYLVAILFFKVRGIPSNYVTPIIAACVPQNMMGFSAEFEDVLRDLNTDLLTVFTRKIRHFVQIFNNTASDSLKASAGEARKTRKVLPRLKSKEDVQRYMTLSSRDVIEFWSPVISFIDADYIDAPSKHSANFFMNLEESLYIILALSATGTIITKKRYSEGCILKDFYSTSCPNTQNSWPVHHVPTRANELVEDWGSFAELWPRPAHSYVNTKGEVLEVHTHSINGDSDEDDMESLFVNEKLSADELEKLWRINDFETDRQKQMVEMVIDNPTVEHRLYTKPDYTTQESDFIAQLNTIGLTAFIMDKLQDRMKSWEALIVAAHEGLEAAKACLKAVEADEENNRIHQEKYRSIMGQTRSVMREVDRKKADVERSKRASANAYKSVQGSMGGLGPLGPILNRRTAYPQASPASPTSSTRHPLLGTSSKASGAMTPNHPRGGTPMSPTRSSGNYMQGGAWGSSAPEIHTQERSGVAIEDDERVMNTQYPGSEEGVPHVKLDSDDEEAADPTDGLKP